MWCKSIKNWRRYTRKTAIMANVVIAMYRWADTTSVGWINNTGNNSSSSSSSSSNIYDTATTTVIIMTSCNWSMRSFLVVLSCSSGISRFAFGFFLEGTSVHSPSVSSNLDNVSGLKKTTDKQLHYDAAEHCPNAVSSELTTDYLSGIRDSN